MSGQIFSVFPGRVTLVLTFSWASISEANNTKTPVKVKLESFQLAFEQHFFQTQNIKPLQWLKMQNKPPYVPVPESFFRLKYKITDKSNRLEGDTLFVGAKAKPN